VIFLSITVDILRTLVCLLPAVPARLLYHTIFKLLVIISISASLLTLVRANTPVHLLYHTIFNLLVPLFPANSSAVRRFYLMALDHHFLRSLSRSGRALEAVLRLTKGISFGQPVMITE